MNSDNFRTVRILLGGEWEEAEFRELEEGDLFELYESDGEHVGTFRALADPYTNIEHDVGEVPVEVVSEGEVDEFIREARSTIEASFKSSRT